MSQSINQLLPGFRPVLLDSSSSPICKAAGIPGKIKAKVKLNFEGESLSVPLGEQDPVLKMTFSPLTAAVGSFFLLLPREGLGGSMG